MDAIQELLSKITTKTREIEDNYPELQKYLEEQRITLPQGEDGPNISKEALKDYLNSLDTMIKKYKNKE